MGTRQVNDKDGHELAGSFGMNYFETSAKADLGVQDLMEHIFAKTYSYKKKNMPKVPEANPAFPLDRVRHSEVATKEHKDNKKKKGGCC